MVIPSGPDQAPRAGDDCHPARPVGGRQVERDFRMEVRFDGTWFHEGAPIRRPALVKLFASVLRRAEDGSYWLITPVERGLIPVEDVPFVAVELRAAGAGRDQRLDLRTNLDEWVPLGPGHPLAMRAPPRAGLGLAPYIAVRDRLEARLSRAVYYEMVDLGTHEYDLEGGRFGVWSRSCFFPLDDGGSVD
jgi:hypothetical protein